MKKLEIIIRHARLHAVKAALNELGLYGMTITEVKGFGCQGGQREIYRGAEIIRDFNPKIKIEVVLAQQLVTKAIDAVVEAARTGAVGDGKIFVIPVEEVIRIRTGETGRNAL